ncbi:MAG: NAD-dependent epimerase/dehydratase family protein [Planctomycetota bacterium]
MNILITGGAGYIGSVISRLALEQNYNVKVIDLLWFDKNLPLLYEDNPNYEFIKGDIRNRDLLDHALKDVDFVIHCAAIVGEPASKKFPELTQQINYDASVELISGAQHHGVKGFVFFSTCSNYGASDGLAAEDAPLKPLSLYARTKVDVEKYLMDKVKDIDWAICRLSTVYGVSDRMRFDLTVNDFTMNAYMKKYLDIFLPFTYRPYIHVYDVATVIMQVISNFDKVRNNVFNVGFKGENYQKIQIAKMVQKFVPDTKIEVVKKGTDLRDYQVDFSKLQRFLNIRKQYSIEDGVKGVQTLLEQCIVTDPYERCYYNTTPDLEEISESGALYSCS